MRKRAPFLLARQMVEEEARHDLVEARKPEHWHIGRIISTSLPKADRNSCGIGFGTSNPEDIPIDVETNDFGFWTHVLEHHSQCARSAAKIEDPIAEPRGKLLQQSRAPRALSHEQSERWIIKSC